MKHIPNKFKHDPDIENGDCHRCCIAAILGLDRDEVPHFFRLENCKDDGDTSDAGWEEVCSFLQSKGLVQAHVLYDCSVNTVLDITKQMMPGVAFILGGLSKIGVGHSVVALDGEIAMDPTGGGIVAPMKDGYYWVTILSIAPPKDEKK